MQKLIKYFVTVGIGLVLAFCISLMKDIFNETDIKTIFHILCDSFFVSAVLIGGLGFLVFASNEGTFDGLVYGMMSFINMFKTKAERKYNSLYEYKESKKENKTKSGFMLISGLIILVIAIIMYLLYQSY